MLGERYSIVGIGVIIGLCVALFIVTAIAYFGGNLNRQYDIQAAYQKCGDLYQCDENDHPIDRFGQPLSKEAVGEIEASDYPDHAKYYERQDLRAQKSMALATDRLVIFSLWSLALGAIGAAAIFVTLRSAVEANTIARQHFVADQRPWITIDEDVKISYIWGEGDGGTLTLTVPVRNSGKTPATGVTVQVLAENAPKFPIVSNKRTVSFARQVANVGAISHGNMIVASNGTSATAIFGHTRDIPDAGGKIVLHVCVPYSGSATGDVFYTARAYEIDLRSVIDSVGNDRDEMGVERLDYAFLMRSEALI